jgi:calcineurin-like phosphoesterase family protein
MWERRMIFFTADTHFGHANIIRYCERPFPSVEEMDETLLSNINARVKVRDTLYHLGDFAFRGANAAAYRSRIVCRRIVLVLGNHDPQTWSGSAKPDFAALFSEVHSLLRLKVPVAGKEQVIVLCHYAMRVWDRAHYGAWHLFGHSHGTLADNAGSLSYDVGVDANGFQPLSLDEVATIMSEKTIQPVDHHRRRSPADL